MAGIAEALDGKHIVAIEPELRAIPSGQLQPVQLVRLYGEKFLATRGRVSEKTQKRNLRVLEHICAVLNRRQTVVEQITAKDVAQTAKELGAGTRGKLTLTKHFWDYCLARGTIRGSNPFELFLAQEKPKVKTDAAVLQRRAISPGSLPPDVERTLNLRIAQAPPSDAKMTGVLLVKEAGLTAAEACVLTWADVLFDDTDPTSVRIALKKEDAAGATHDYTRPVSRFCATELRSRRPEKMSASILQERLLTSGGKPLDKKALTAACRTELLHAGMGYAPLQTDRSEPLASVSACF